jgi:hypothetical protein
MSDGYSGASLADRLGSSPIQDWYDRTVLAPLRQMHEDLASNEQFVGVREQREAFWNGALNVATLGLYNGASIAFTGRDIYDQPVYGRERTLAQVEVALSVVSLVPWSRVATIGGRVGESVGAGFGKVGAFLDETAPRLNLLGNYRVPGGELYSGLPRLQYVSPLGEGQSMWDASRASRGFKSFEDLKKFLGSSGEGNQWHHIVEQNPFNINKFGPEAIHNVDNMVPISGELNGKLNAFYQTKNPLTSGLSPREWLQGKTLQQNYDFGRVALEYVGRGIW